MTDREFENIIKEKFSAVKCSDVGKKRIFDALKGADDMNEKTGRNVFNEKTSEIQEIKAARVSRKPVFDEKLKCHESPDGYSSLSVLHPSL